MKEKNMFIEYDNDLCGFIKAKDYSYSIDLTFTFIDYDVFPAYYLSDLLPHVIYNYNDFYENIVIKYAIELNNYVYIYYTINNKSYFAKIKIKDDCIYSDNYNKSDIVALAKLKQEKPFNHAKINIIYRDLTKKDLK